MPSPRRLKYWLVAFSRSRKRGYVNDLYLYNKILKPGKGKNMSKYKAFQEGVGQRRGQGIALTSPPTSVSFSLIANDFYLQVLISFYVYI
jgi:hypothetical protein